MNTTSQASEILETLGIAGDSRLCTPGEPGSINAIDPATGEVIAAVRLQGPQDYDDAVDRARAAQKHWAMLPAPKRGELVRRMGNAFRELIEPLGELVTLESGKIRAEGIGALVIDSSPRPAREPVELAAWLGGTCLPLPRARGAAFSASVAAHLGG